MARLAFVFLALLAAAASVAAQGGKIIFTRSRTSFTPDPESKAKAGTSLAATYDITTTTPPGCTGKLYQTATYAVVDASDWEKTWANFALSFYLDGCKTIYKKGAIFAAGLGTAISANSSYPKAVFGGFGDSFKTVTSGYLERTATTPKATYTLTYK